MYADLCVRTSDVEKTLNLGKDLNLAMIGFIVLIEELPKIEKLRSKRDWRQRPMIALGTEIINQKPSQVGKTVSNLRNSAEIIVARGGTEELNRAILETPKVDILINHELEGRCGINHILAKLAKKNNISIAFDLNRLMVSYRMGRIQEFSAMRETAKLVKRFRSPFILTSGAMDPWDMRSPSELIALGKQLGFTESEAKKGLSTRIVKENKKRLSGKWIMPGVEIE